MELDYKQKQEQTEIEKQNRNVEELIQLINNRFNQYLDQKEEQKQRNPIEVMIDEFRMEIEEWKE